MESGAGKWGVSISPSNKVTIVELSKVWIEKAARLYAEGLLMEEPPGSTDTLEDLSDSLQLHLEIYLQQKKNRHIWLALENDTVVGLLDFYHRPEELFIRFICAIPPRRGTGTRLLHHLANYGFSQQINVIRTTVSSLDLRAQQFYFRHLGFQKIGRRTEDPGFDLYICKIRPQDLLKTTAT